MKLNFSLIKQTWYFWRYVVHDFMNDGCAYRAAALTFTGLLALVPLMVVSFKIFSVFPAFSDIGEKIQYYIFTHFIASAGQEIQSYLENFSHQASRLSMVGLAFLVITALVMMQTIEQALNKIWKVKIARRGLSAFFRYWTVLTLAPLLIAFSIILTSYLFNLSFFSEGTHKTFLLSLTPSLFTLIGFLILYIGVPNCKVSFYSAIFGAVIATFLFEISKQSFAFYILHFPTYQLIYGAFSAVPIFLIWMYISWLIVLFGAEICYVSSLHYQYSVVSKLDAFTQAYRWLGYLWQAQQRGKALSLEDLVSQDNFHYEYEPRVMMRYLLNVNLVEQTKDGDFVLQQDLHNFTLYDLYKCLPWRLPEADTLSKHDQWQKKLSELVGGVHKNMQEIFNIPLADFFQNK